MVGGECGSAVHDVEVRNGVVRMVWGGDGIGADSSGLRGRSPYKRRREERRWGLKSLFIL